MSISWLYLSWRLLKKFYHKNVVPAIFVFYGAVCRNWLMNEKRLSISYGIYLPNDDQAIPSQYMSLYSPISKISCSRISWSLEAARMDAITEIFGAHVSGNTLSPTCPNMKGAERSLKEVIDKKELDTLRRFIMLYGQP